MQELVKVTTNATGSQVVSARELHEYLEIETKFIDWFKRRIEKYGFVENQDFVLASQNWETNNPKNPITKVIDYALTLDAAKELAMVEGNDKGKTARQYFIECERRLKSTAVQTPFLPQSFSEALYLAAKLQQEKEVLEAQNAKLAPKAEYTDKVLASDTELTTTTIAKELGMSAVALNKRLCEEGVQYAHDKHYVLYAKYQNKGLAELRTYQWHDRGGASHTRHYTVWTERGRAFIHSLVNKDLSFSRVRKEAVQC